MTRLFALPHPTALLSALVLVACSAPDTPAPAEEPPLVSALALVSRSVQMDDDLPGRVAAVRTAEIRPQVGGIVQRRQFAQGAEVKEGQVLFQINPAPFQAEVDNAEANLKRATAVLGRARQQAERLGSLVDADAVSRQLYDDALAQSNQAAAEVDQARANLARRRLDLGYATVRAPIGGRIGEELVTEGALVGTADLSPMARIQQIDQVYVDVRQPASMLETIRASAGQGGEGGGKAQILDARGEPYPVSGRILFSGINVDAGTGDVVLRIRVDNAERRLLPGMFVRARVPRGAPVEGMLVPQQAVIRGSDGQPRVWLLDAADKARLRSVQVGKVKDGEYLVESGLQAGERLVIEGQDRLREGEPARVQAWAGGAAQATTGKR